MPVYHYNCVYQLNGSKQNTRPTFKDLNAIIVFISSSISLDDGVDALHGGRPGLFSIRSKSGSKIGSQEIHQHFGQVLL
jgi:hypothetical protein